MSSQVPQTAPADIYDPGFVKGVFDRCSGKYIAFSYACSLGFTERWRRQCVQSMPTLATENPVGYDLMAGTGEVWPHLLRRWPKLASITAIDISSGMHLRAMERLHKHRAHRIDFIEDNVLESALADESANFVVSTFGLKTFNSDQHRQLAKLVARVLKPGGTFAFIEASDPKGWILRPLYRLHLRVVLPMIERLFLNGAQDFTMIGDYSENFGNATQFAEYLRSEGLEVVYHKYFFGCASGVSGIKPT
tara:strand:+ start:96 stop:842 length:747 start_codon:yes stop_codon:yes gene_type:complete